MEEYEKCSPMPVSADQLFEWHTRPDALKRLLPPWQKVEVVHKDGELKVGAETVLRMHILGIPRLWVARHVELERGRLFVDEQVQGPFAYWKHVHRMIPIDQTHSKLEDKLSYQTPLKLGKKWAAKEIAALFEYRHCILRRDLEIQNSLISKCLKIAITGASGLLGSALSSFLRTAGHEVQPLSRSFDEIEGIDICIHLAGENVGQRWNAKVKREIKESRVEGTKRLVAKLNQLSQPPKLLISASGSGFYGECEEATEEDGAGKTFLAQVCQNWEAEAHKFKGRVCCPRTAIVLTPAGGMLKRLLPAFKSGLGGRVGSGKQLMSWITIHDWVYNLYRLIVDESFEGPINFAAASCSQESFAKTLGKVLKKTTLMPLPKSAVRTIFGEMGEELMLTSQSLQLNPGLHFYDQELEKALRLMLGRSESLPA